MTELTVTTPRSFSVRAVPTNPTAVNGSLPTVILVPVPGGQGDEGPPGTGTQIVGEIPAGVKDGVNLVFTTAGSYGPNTTAVYRNGLRETRTVGYTESGAGEITLTTAPELTDDLSIDYVIP